MTARARGPVSMMRALCWFAAVLCAACGGDAGEASEGTTESVNALSASVSPGSTAPAAPGETHPGPSAPAQPSQTAAPSIPLIPPPSEQPSPLPHAALDTPRSLDRLAPAEVVIEPGDCRFEFLGEWVRCENAGWPNTLATDAPDLESCMRQCLERDDCTAVTDYLWLGQPELGCYLYLSTCDEPQFEAWGEEDAGRDFRRRCDDAGAAQPSQ